MRKTRDFEFPDEQKQLLRRARRLEWWTLAYQISDAILLYFVMGASQAMKTAWVEDVLSLIPPIVFLAATPIARWKPNERFVYGYHRSTSIAFLAAAGALLAFGIYLLIDGVIPFVQMERPTIGAVHFAGYTIWLGWLMLAALVWSAVPPYLFGRVKLPLAPKINDKVLYADARMNKAGWMAAVAAMLGVIGIGFGLWWADYVAAIAISLDVIHDGYVNLKTAIFSLMDAVPKTTDKSQVDPVIQRVKERIEQLDWVQEAEVRLREEGHVYFGEAFVVPTSEEVSVEILHRAAREIANLDWKLHDIVLVPTASLGSDHEPSPEQRD